MDTSTILNQLNNSVPRFEIREFGSITAALNLVYPPFAESDFSQIEYIERHLSKHSKKPLSMVIEKHYIDRGFMDDYTTFYGSSLKPYPNWCRRIHFFSTEKDRLANDLEELLAEGQKAAGSLGRRESRLEFLSKCRSFSEESYLGFVTIKPLEGSPVGRTVLRHYEEGAPDGKRRFNCTRHYTVHLFGLELTVCGLVFQEQDQAVSACATTALWTSLSKTKDFEDIKTPTPAEITKRATQFLLSGPAIPAIEGLALQQMCQAIQSFGLTPYVIRAAAADPIEIKSHLFSSVLSGFAPVLLIYDGTKDRGHAVTVSGMKTASVHKPDLVMLNSHTGVDLFDDLSGDLLEIYVNDDRYSPYFKVKVESLNVDKSLAFCFYEDDGVTKREPDENWTLEHILIPVHPKMRLSFAEIRQIAYGLINQVNSLRTAYATLNSGTVTLNSVVRLKTRIMKHSTYVEKQFFGDSKLSTPKWNDFNEKIFLSRYVGVVTIEDEPTFGSLDVLVDTTNIKRNPHYLGIIGHTKDVHFAKDIIEPLAKFLGDCPTIIDG